MLILYLQSLDILALESPSPIDESNPSNSLAEVYIYIKNFLEFTIYTLGIKRCSICCVYCDIVVMQIATQDDIDPDNMTYEVHDIQ